MPECLQIIIPINNLTTFSISNNNFKLLSSNCSFKQQIHIVFKPHSNNKFTLSSSLTQTTTSQYLQTPLQKLHTVFKLAHHTTISQSLQMFPSNNIIHCVQTHIKKQIIMVKKKLHNDFRFCLLTKISWSLFKNHNAFKLSHSYNNVTSSYSPSNNTFTNPFETTTLSYPQLQARSLSKPQEKQFQNSNKIFCYA